MTPTIYNNFHEKSAFSEKVTPTYLMMIMILTFLKKVTSPHPYRPLRKIEAARGHHDYAPKFHLDQDSGI